MPKYRATKYIRLSYTDDRSTESDSVGNQRKLIDDFVSRNPDIEIVSERIDDGYSGTIFERPEIQRLIEMVRSNQVDCIIVKDFSRFGRNSIETGDFIERVFPLFHTRFIAIGDGFDTEEHKGGTGGLEVAFK